MTPARAAPPATRARRGIRVRGTVQGIGMRPAIYRLASELGLAGFVRNDPQGVWIEIEGEAGALAGFLARLPAEVPPLGRIDRVDVVELVAGGQGKESGFRVETSAERGSASAAVPPDAATCEACLAELFDPRDRRHRYPFINCTECGPRYTIVRDVPYDRVRTTMADFPLCARCRAEYDDPTDRRFHAEPNACPECGPRLTFSAGGAPETGESALRATTAALAAGNIVAVKGLGGYHLAVDAASDAAVARLRQRKHRPDKPLALMVRSLEVAAAIAVVDPAAAAALRSQARPIVLVHARGAASAHGAPRIAAGVAPGLAEIGLMLPYTPLHHLLLADGPPVLVMTSGNRAEEPIAREEEEARAALAGIADAFLVHDREIHSRADDSVVRPVAGVIQAVRRSRGSVPESIEIGVSAPPICAVGAELKNAVCLTRGDRAYLSPHVGDLTHPKALSFFTEVIDKLGRLLGVEPVVAAHDLHPDYQSTRWALDSRLAREPIQHHHAHIAACLTDNQRSGPVLGVAFDGSGCGPSGDLWGGEILFADLTGFARVAHLWPLPLPGGEAAIREPWRVAAAALLEAGLPLDLLARVPRAKLAAVAQLCRGAPRATGAGRWFDAIAALCSVRDAVTYEGQAAIELEAAIALAGRPIAARPYELAVVEDCDRPAIFDLRPTVRAVAADLQRGVETPVVAARFHRTLAEVVLIAARCWCRRLGADSVALSGGCFQNKVLTETTVDLLAGEGIEVIVHGRVPPNDGGIALGQAAIAAHRWHRRQDGGSHVPRHPG